MEAKQKAEELVIKFTAKLNQVRTSENKEVSGYAKQCALIAVDEITGNWIGYVGPEYYSCNNDEIQCDEKYWLRVKEEINKL